MAKGVLLYFFLLGLLPGISGQERVPGRYGEGGHVCALDIAFILDSSESAKLLLFGSEKTFVNSFSQKVTQMKLGDWELRIRLAAIQYSSIVFVDHKFSDWKNLDEFLKRLGDMVYIGQGTYTTYAITNATQLFHQETRPDSVRVALLMTDGQDHPRNPDVISAAAEAKSSNIKIFTIGLTDVAQQTQARAKLRAIASAPAQQFVHSLREARLEETLLQEISALALEECPKRLPPVCPCEKGERGLPGYTGPKGEPGFDGLAGAKGSKGEHGLDGRHGLDGVEGRPGYKGDKGERGDCGAPGFKGDKGTLGFQGPRGPRGLQGVNGPPGDQGPEGLLGPKGDRGTQGAPGPQGDAGVGYPGQKGDKGIQGLPGPNGLRGTGEPGLPGPPGLPGKQGVQGEPGEGEPGPKGERGFEGPKGGRGPSGVGIKGQQGNVGPPGAPGPLGGPGTGIQGEKGNQGPIGPPGVRGLPGLGLIGPKGEQGFAGEPGLPGERGIGPPGPKGEHGLVGLNGPPGSPGDDGSTGTKGEIGLPGPRGLDGPPGRGLPGEKGERGDRGGRGPPGTVGPLGSSGPKGNQGVPGPPGSIGPPGRGIPGAKGDSGPVGPVGPMGEPGVGIIGPKGERGTAGPTGSPGGKGNGYPGPPGAPGMPGLTGEAGPEGRGLPGPKGDRGGPGRPGPTGSPGTGQIGPKGSIGQNGPPGPRGMPGEGIQGPKGDAGYQGLPGPRGEPGNGLPGVKGDRGFTGERGIKGEKGVHGELGSEGRPGRVGQKGEPGLTRAEIIEIVRSICACGMVCRVTPLELVFVIDSSESVGPENFAIVKDFVNGIVDHASVSPNVTRVGVVLYSHIHMVVTSLAQNATQDDVKSAVRRMVYLGEGTYTGSALRQSNRLFQAARPSIRKVAVVITDGQTDTRDVVKLEDAVREAHSANIETFVIGVVNQSDPFYEDFLAELNIMASDPDKEHVFMVHDFSTLPALENKLLQHICERNNGELLSRVPSTHLATGTHTPLSEAEETDTLTGPFLKPEPPVTFENDTRFPSPSRPVKPVTRFPPRPPITDTPTVRTEDDQCKEALDPGPCGTYVVKWYFEPKANSCAQFWYGGCKGNQNRFDTEKSCRSACVKG